MEMYSREGAEKRRNEALANGNALIFYRFSEELGMVPETQYERDLYEVGSIESVSERLASGKDSKLTLKLKNKKIRDKELIDAVESARIDFRDSVRGLNEKERILRNILGYERLRIGKGQFTPLEDCKPARINMMLRREYDTAVKRRKRIGQ